MTITEFLIARATDLGSGALRFAHDGVIPTGSPVCCAPALGAPAYRAHPHCINSDSAVWIGGQPTPSEMVVLRHLAAVYSDHDDYQQEWSAA